MPEQIETCPVCAFAPDAETDIYTHVLTSHRKRAIVEALLERRPARPARR